MRVETCNAREISPKSMLQLVSVPPNWLKQETVRFLIGLKGVLRTAVSSLHVMFKNTFVNDLRLNKDSLKIVGHVTLLCQMDAWRKRGSTIPLPTLEKVRSTCSRTCNFVQTFS